MNLTNMNSKIEWPALAAVNNAELKQLQNWFRALPSAKTAHQLTVIRLIEKRIENLL